MKRLFIMLLLLFPAVIYSQFISIKSLPVSTGDQFVLFPSKNLSMGGVSIALSDPWMDPVENPAYGSDIKNLNLFVTPAFYNISDNLGGAWSLPVTIFAKHKNWFGLTSFAYQQLREANIDNGALWRSVRLTGPREKTHNNQYVFISLGRKLSSGKWSVGGSFFWSNINAMGGVDLLYNNSIAIEQDGNIYELRGGLMYEGEFSTFEAVLLFNKLKMQHDVKYENWILFDDFIGWNENVRTETNLDQTNTWGLHLEYKERMTNEGLYLGALTTVNLKTHPKIPNYEIMNIPRDPGDTWAFNFGIGLGINRGPTRFGIDLIYEPIWSNTWAEAAEDIILWDGNKILAGEKTVENNFTFNNIIGRLGLSIDLNKIDCSVGLEIYERQYSLDQTDFINQNRRSQDEDWTETTWTWGIGLHFKYFEIKYTGHVVTGAGIPGVSQVDWWGIDDRLLEAASFDIIAAPSGSLNLDEKTTTLHQFVISVPLSAEL